jgi:hypothetical protein
VKGVGFCGGGRPKRKEFKKYHLLGICNDWEISQFSTVNQKKSANNLNNRKTTITFTQLLTPAIFKSSE